MAPGFGIQMNVTYNMDCMEAMRQMPDKCFDLAVVDPPYGGGAALKAKGPASGADGENGRERLGASGSGLTATIYAARTGGTWAAKYQVRGGGSFERDIRHWDIAPGKEYFDELARVSKNQIIWGGNYFDLPPTRCFLVWYKSNIPTEGFTMAPVEYAWTSFGGNAGLYIGTSAGGAGREKRFHPTQKPVALYRWIFQHYARPGDKILDTHLGSGSSRIAAYEAGLDFAGFEVDAVYFGMEEKRFEEHAAQASLFDGQPGQAEENLTIWDI